MPSALVLVDVGDAVYGNFAPGIGCSPGGHNHLGGKAIELGVTSPVIQLIRYVLRHPVPDAAI